MPKAKKASNTISDFELGRQVGQLEGMMREAVLRTQLTDPKPRKRPADEKARALMDACFPDGVGKRTTYSLVRTLNAYADKNGLEPTNATAINRVRGLRQR